MFSKSVLGKRSATPRKPTSRKRRGQVSGFTNAFKKAVQKIAAVESKYARLALSISVDQPAPVMTQLTQIADGVLNSERIGLGIDLDYVDIRGTITAANQTTEGAIWMRVIVFQAKRSANPTATDLFGTATPTEWDMFARNPQFNAFYVVYMDEQFSISSDGGSIAIPYQNNAKSLLWASGDKAVFHRIIKFPRGLKVEYDGANATDASFGNIWMLCISNAASGEDAVLTGEAQLKFRG